MLSYTDLVSSGLNMIKFICLKDITIFGFILLEEKELGS